MAQDVSILQDMAQTLECVLHAPCSLATFAARDGSVLRAGFLVLKEVRVLTRTAE